MEEILYYLLVATGVSFVWMLMSGYRPKGEPRLLGLIHLLAIVFTAGLVFWIWRGEVGLAAGLTIGYGLMAALLSRLLPDWNTRGQTFLTAFGAVQVVFLARIVWAIAVTDLAPLVRLVSLLLFSAEVIVVTLTIYFAYEVLNLTCRLRWRRYSPPYSGPNDYWPKVSIHVPAHSEPTEMVVETLTALRNLDYPTYEVIMVDDNTDDDELWRPVVEFCHRNGIKVFHLQDYPGFKSGALNFALTQTAADVEVVAVVDSDYVVAPNFLRETVPYFHNPRVAFVQTPQSFRNHDDNLFAHFSALAQRFSSRSACHPATSRTPSFSAARWG